MFSIFKKTFGTRCYKNKIRRRRQRQKDYSTTSPNDQQEATSAAGDNGKWAYVTTKTASLLSLSSVEGGRADGRRARLSNLTAGTEHPSSATLSLLMIEDNEEEECQEDDSRKVMEHRDGEHLRTAEKNLPEEPKQRRSRTTVSFKDDDEEHIDIKTPSAGANNTSRNCHQRSRRHRWQDQSCERGLKILESMKDTSSNAMRQLRGDNLNEIFN